MDIDFIKKILNTANYLNFFKIILISLRGFYNFTYKYFPQILKLLCLNNFILSSFFNIFNFNFKKKLFFFYHFNNKIRNYIYKQNKDFLYSKPNLNLLLSVIVVKYFYESFKLIEIGLSFPFSFLTTSLLKSLKVARINIQSYKL